MLVILLCFTTAAVAEQSVLWIDNSGFDPVTGENWKIDVGTLHGWQVSNFETLKYQTAGKSQVVGTGITVEGIKVDWEYPRTGFIGKGDGPVGNTRLDQSIDYTIVTFAEIPCVLSMDIFGNGGGINDDGFTVLNEENEIPVSDLMLFSPSMGGIVDADWKFIEMDAVGYATGQAVGAYINACDLWSANLWANVPYGFSVSSAGLGYFDSLEDPLLIEMRYLEILGAGIISQEPGLSSYDENVVSLNSDWAGDYVLNEDGVEIGAYEAGQNVHINMQFRIPLTGAPAGRYQGEVTFSTYTI